LSIPGHPTLSERVVSGAGQIRRLDARLGRLG
jgi:hypothetical protein